MNCNFSWDNKETLMGMEGSMYQITPDGLEIILGSEDAFERLYYFLYPPEDLDKDEEAEGLRNEEHSYCDEEGLELEKMWHLVHYLITGDPDNADYPLGYAIMAGYYLFQDSWPEWSFVPSDYVKDVAEALAVLSDDDLRKTGKIRPTPRLYKYPSMFRGCLDLEEAIEYFHKLKDYYQDAPKKRECNTSYFCLTKCKSSLPLSILRTWFLFIRIKS